MDYEGRKTVDIRKKRLKKAESQRPIEKDEITHTESSESGNPFIQRTPLRHPLRGESVV